MENADFMILGLGLWIVLLLLWGLWSSRPPTAERPSATARPPRRGRAQALRASLMVGLTLAGLWGATHWTAARLRYHPALGPPWGSLDGLRLYPPWAYGGWWVRWGAAPCPWGQAVRTGQWWVLGGMASALGTGLVLRVLRGREAAASTAFGSARWATRQDVACAGLFGEGHSILLGTFGGRYLRHNGPQHVLVIAPPRSGKTAGVVIPTLLSVEGSVVVNDIKGEVWAATAGWRAQHSRCVYFNPTDPQSARYNPLLEVRQGPNEVRDAQNIAGGCQVICVTFFTPAPAPQTKSRID